MQRVAVAAGPKQAVCRGATIHVTPERLVSGAREPAPPKSV